MDRGERSGFPDTEVIELSFCGAIQTVFKLICYGMGAEIEIKRKEAAN
jgi:hypothetical protein